MFYNWKHGPSARPPLCSVLSYCDGLANNSCQFDDFVMHYHKGTGVHIFGDAKNFCPNLILLS